MSIDDPLGVAREGPAQSAGSRWGRTADRFADVCDGIDKAAAYLAAAGLALMTVILVTEVVLRLFLTRSTLVADEIASYMLAFVSFMALGHTLRTGAHLRVDLIMRHLSVAARWWLDVATSLLGLFTTLFFTIWLTRFVIQSYRYNIDSQSQLETPLWIPQSALVVGAGILFLALIARLIRILRHEITP